MVRFKFRSLFRTLLRTLFSSQNYVGCQSVRCKRHIDHEIRLETCRLEMVCVGSINQIIQSMLLLTRLPKTPIQ